MLNVVLWLLALDHQITILAPRCIAIRRVAADLLDLIGQLRCVPSDLFDALADDIILLAQLIRIVALVDAQQELLVRLVFESWQLAFGGDSTPSAGLMR